MTTKTYIIQAGDTNYYKIGKTKRSVHKRLKELQTGSKDKLTVHIVFNEDIEVELHKKYTLSRLKGTEWFLIADINELTANAEKIAHAEPMEMSDDGREPWEFKWWMTIPALGFIYFCEFVAGLF
jgi:hypothetical protein